MNGNEKVFFSKMNGFNCPKIYINTSHARNRHIFMSLTYRCT